jgi:hypothetical protein
MNKLTPKTHVKRLSFSQGSLIAVVRGRFIVRQYSGNFIEPSLAAKASTGLWYATATGTGLEIEGEGASPLRAIMDMKKRALEMANEINRVYSL